MKRSELIKAGVSAAPIALLAACGGSSSLLSSGSLARPLTASGCPKPHWKADESDAFSHAGASGQSNIYHKEGPSCDWVKMGGVKMDFQINKGSQFTEDNLTFWSGDDTMTIQLVQLEDYFSPGSILQLFKKWYWKTHGDGLGGTLYEAATSAMLATSTWTKDASKQTVTIYQGSTSVGESYTVDWGTTSSLHNRRLRSADAVPDITENCALATASYFGACIAWVVAAAGTLAGPVEWLGFAGLTVTLFAAAGNMLEQCNGGV